MSKTTSKHPSKVHVWEEINKKGVTGKGTMDAPLYCEILTRTLIPFLAEKFPTPNSHRFMQDNDPKHCS